MSSFLNRLAPQIERILPGFWQRMLRRRYYLRVVMSYSESRWEWSPFIKPFLPVGGCVLDIGANVGYLSALFARWVGPGGHVLSIEPIPATYDVLASSMEHLFPDTVTTLPVCVSDASGEVTMSVPNYENGGSNYYESRIVNSHVPTDAHTFKVTATTLDHLIQTHLLDRKLSFIKIDVEGHELAVIRGGSDFLATHHPPLLIEVAGNPDEPGSTSALLFSTLANWGYTPHLIVRGELQRRNKGDQSVDYLFVHRP